MNKYGNTGKNLSFVCVVLLIICISNTNAQETAEEQNNRVSFYVHPFSLMFNTWFSNTIYSTVEIPLDLSNSLIIKPSFLRESASDHNLFRLGSDFGMRHYLNGKGEGLYLQGQIGVFYYKINRVYSDEHGNFLLFPEIPIKSLWLDAMGYLGYSRKFSNVVIFADIGFGVMHLFSLEQRNEFKDFFKGFFMFPDMNLGVGIPFR